MFLLPFTTKYRFISSHTVSSNRQAVSFHRGTSALFEMKHLVNPKTNLQSSIMNTLSWIALLPLASALVVAHSTNDIKHFTVNIPPKDIYDTRQMLSFSRIGPLTYESSHNDTNYGISGDWLSGAKNEWLNKFDW